jgi:hypothetical protein
LRRQLLKSTGTATLRASPLSMFRAPSLPSKTQLPKVFRRLGLFVRVVAVVIALQMSGALHAAADALMSCAGLVAAGDCDDGEDGKQCPPGCPNSARGVRRLVIVDAVGGAAARAHLP